MPKPLRYGLWKAWLEIPDAPLPAVDGAVDVSIVKQVACLVSRATSEGDTVSQTSEN